MAVNRRLVKGKERVADFFNIVAWQGTAEFAAKNFKKGQPMCVEGRLQQRSWIDDEKVTRYVTEVVAESVHFAGFLKEDAQNSNAGEHFDPYANQSAA